MPDAPAEPTSPTEVNAGTPATPPAVKESLAQQFERIAEGAGGLTEDKTRAEPELTDPEKPLETPPDEEDTKPDKPAKKPPKAPKVVEPPAPPANELEALRQQATRLGLVVEDGKVTTKERAEFRAARRAEAERRAAEEQAMIQRIEAAKQEATGGLERAQKFEAAVDAGDFEGIAVSLGFKSVPAEGDKPARTAWDALLQDQVDRNADPNYKRLRRLEQEASERAERDARAAQEAQARQEEAARAQARAQYQQSLVATMKTSSDPLIAAFHDEQGLVNAIFSIQMQEYQAGNAVPTPEQAVRMKLRGVAQTPREWLEGYYRRLSPVLGAPAPAATPAAAPNPMAKPAPKTTTVPKPAPVRRAKWQNEQAEKQDMVRRLEEAARADEATYHKTGVWPT